MSVIQKSSPLNLMGKVAIVTSASTPLGAQTCRTLLRHNCLVLGLAENPIPDSEGLFSSLGTHFQTLTLDLEDQHSLDKIIKHSEERFWKQGFDVLITFDSSNSNSAQLRMKIVDIMSATGGGVVLNVVNDGTAGEFDDIIKTSERSSETGVRANIVRTDQYGCEDTSRSLLAPDGAIDEVKECVNRFQALAEMEKDQRKVNKGVADLLLYLSSSLGLQSNGVTLTLNGGWKEL